MLKKILAVLIGITILLASCQKSMVNVSHSSFIKQGIVSTIPVISFDSTNRYELVKAHNPRPVFFNDSFLVDNSSGYLKSATFRIDNPGHLSLTSPKLFLNDQGLRHDVYQTDTSITFVIRDVLPAPVNIGKSNIQVKFTVYGRNQIIQLALIDFTVVNNTDTAYVNGLPVYSYRLKIK